MDCLLTGIVAGLDEAGRGPLAGPVISSCIAWQGLPAVRAPVNDSKLLSEQQRNSLFPWIVSNAYKVGVGLATPREIEEFNIHNATLLSMERALKAVHAPPWTSFLLTACLPFPLTPTARHWSKATGNVFLSPAPLSLLKWSETISWKSMMTFTPSISLRRIRVIQRRSIRRQSRCTDPLQFTAGRSGA